MADKGELSPADREKAAAIEFARQYASDFEDAMLEAFKAEQEENPERVQQFLGKVPTGTDLVPVSQSGVTAAGVPLPLRPEGNWGDAEMHLVELTMVEGEGTIPVLVPDNLPPQGAPIRMPDGEMGVIYIYIDQDGDRAIAIGIPAPMEIKGNVIQTGDGVLAGIQMSSELAQALVEAAQHVEDHSCAKAGMFLMQFSMRVAVLLQKGLGL